MGWFERHEMRERLRSTALIGASLGFHALLWLALPGARASAAEACARAPAVGDVEFFSVSAPAERAAALAGPVTPSASAPARRRPRRRRRLTRATPPHATRMNPVERDPVPASPPPTPTVPAVELGASALRAETTGVEGEARPTIDAATATSTGSESRGPNSDGGGQAQTSADGATGSGTPTPPDPHALARAYANRQRGRVHALLQRETRHIHLEVERRVLVRARVLPDGTVAEYLVQGTSLPASVRARCVRALRSMRFAAPPAGWPPGGRMLRFTIRLRGASS